MPMTTEEQKRIIGGVVLDYVEVKQQLIALDADLEAALTTVSKVENAVRQGQQNVIGMFKDWPTAEYLTNLLNEIEIARKRKDVLEKSLKGYGLEL